MQDNKVKLFIKKYFTYRLHSKTLLWSTNIRIFCDGGCPVWTWIPKIHKNYYSSYWNMWGIVIQIFGRQVFFSFGKDINGLYNGL